MDTPTRIVEFAAILLELGGAVLVWVLFALVRRYALHRAYFATWGSAWLAMVAATAAVAVRYVLLGTEAGGPVDDAAIQVRLLYVVYQCGKLLFFGLVCRGAVEYAVPTRAFPRWWSAALVGYGALSCLFSYHLNALLVWQAPVAVACCAAGAMALFELPEGRRSVGSVVTGVVLAGTAVLWAIYFFVFASAAKILPTSTPLVAGDITRFNSYVDMLAAVTLGYAMMVLFMEDARLRISASEARLAALVASAAEAIVTTDRDLRLLDVNFAAERLFGIPRDAAAGRSLESLVVPDDQSRLRQALASFLDGPDTWTVLDSEDEFRAIRHDGSTFTFEASASKLRSNDATSLALVLRDVTERREQEERRRQTQKMDTVRQLAGGLAHDFNNLLTAIIGRSQIIARSTQTDALVREGVLEIERTASAAARLARGLLALSHREPLHPELMSLNATVRSAEGSVRATAGPQVATEFRYAADAGDVHVDPARLRDVLLAVVQNARDAIGARGGRIVVDTARVTRPAGPGRTVEMASIGVGDSGPGLSAEARAHLFEPFFSTKGDGRGLGLATAYSFVQQSGGSLDVQSGGVGTTVRLALPIVTAAAPVEHASRAGWPAATSSSAPAVQPTVLVAEDEEAVRRFVRIVLEKEGMRVMEATNGIEALAAFDAADPPVDLLLTDVVMPQMGGRELAERLIAARPALRVVFMSGFVNDGDLLQGLGDRGVAFLQKPFDIEELARVVRAEVRK